METEQTYSGGWDTDTHKALVRYTEYLDTLTRDERIALVRRNLGLADTTPLTRIP